MKHQWNILPCLFFLCFGPLQAQQTDSLWSVYNNPSLDSTTRIEGLHKMARYFLSNDPDSALALARMEQSFAESMRDSGWIAYALNLQGGAHSMLNDFPAAMDRFYRMLDIRTAIRDTVGIAAAYNNIGNIFYYKGDFPKAIDYYIRSLRYEELGGSRTGMAASYINIGSIYAQQDDYPKAIDYFNRALHLYREIGDENGAASCYSNLGNAHKSIDSLAIAIDYYRKAETLMTKVNDQYGLGIVYINMAEINRIQGNFRGMLEYYSRCEKIRKALGDDFGVAMVQVNRGTAKALEGDFKGAVKECEAAMPVVEKYESIKELRDACECLYLAYKGLNQEDKALAFFERSAALKDSIGKEETMSRLQVMEFRTQVTKDSLQREADKELLTSSHQKQLRKSNRVRNIMLSVGAIMLGLAIVFYRLFRKTRESKAQSDTVLQNILPADIAEQLLTTGKVDAQQFDDVTIIFTDMVEFTQTSEHMAPQELVNELNFIYSHFDEIIARHGVEKIKSIGDAYMAAGGLPEHDVASVKQAVWAAIDMQTFIREHNLARAHAGQPAFEMRAGVHTGPVVAGIIGVKKYQYDIWGDTVNTANRMETNSYPGRVNISETTYQFIQNEPEFLFEARPKKEVKGKGEMQMYFVWLNEQYGRSV